MKIEFTIQELKTIRYALIELKEQSDMRAVKYEKRGNTYLQWDEQKRRDAADRLYNRIKAEMEA